MHSVGRMVSHLCFASEGFKLKIQRWKDGVKFRECFQEKNCRNREPIVANEKCEVVVRLC